MSSTVKFFLKAKVVDQAEPSKYWLEEVRKRHNLGSDAKLAEHLKLSKSAISQLMSGKTRIGVKTAVIIGGMLDVDPLLIISSVLALVEDEHQAFWNSTFEERTTDQK